MAVSLYTSRVILNTLGVEDYGIYNVVGGVVTMFAFLNGALVTSTQRYLTYELGRNDFHRLKKVFTTSILIHAIISLLIVLLAETAGLWFLNNKMIIPEERVYAASWVFQFSIITMVVQVMIVPFNSIIIAHEKMNVFAIISIIEVFLKLFIVYLLLFSCWDKLIVYALLFSIAQVIILCVYIFYCRKKYEETTLVKGIERGLVVEMGKFAGWNVWGNLAGTLFGTGLNLLLNVFFGPVVNAARGIAVQVEAAMNQFSTSFLMAVNPQITKLYAQGNLNEMHTLLFRSSKFTGYLLLMLTIPVVLETNTILVLWLKTVPDYTVSFIRVLLCIVIMDSMARPLMTAAAATGDVKKYQSVIGGILLAIVPVAYVVLKLGAKPTSVYIVHLIICAIACIARLLIVRPMINLSIKDYSRAVLLPSFIVTVLSFVSALGLHLLLPNGFCYTIIVCLYSVFIVAILAYTVGLTKGERSFVNDKLVTLYKRVARHD